MTPDEKNKLAQRAILHVLARVRQNEKVADAMGPGTESFDLLTATASALSGEPLARVRDYVAPGSNALIHQTAEEFLSEC